MSKSVNNNYTDTAVEGKTSFNVSLPILNWPVNFAVKTDEADEVIVTNLTSTLGREEKIRFSIQNVNNVYKNSSLSPSLYSTDKTGVKLLIQLTDVFSVVDDTDASYEQVVPMEGHIVLTIPNNPNITTDMIASFVLRLISATYKKAGTASNLGKLARGALKPAEL